jgi:CysZ protein
VLVLVWITFPGVVGIVTGFLLERVAGRIEARSYPGQPPAREQGTWDAVRIAVNFALISIGLNILALLISALLFFWIPIIYPMVFYALNGYLLGREYFELVALRRLDDTTVRALRRSYQGSIFLSGAMIAVLTTVPLLNLAAPVVATAFMVHLFESLRRRVGMVQSA